MVLHMILLQFLIIGGAGTTRTQVMPSCYFQGLDLIPCLMSSAGAGNISEACCRSLNQALDAGHRCFCSVLLSNNVLAGLTSLSTLPLVLPLPGCSLYAPSLAACQASLPQTIAPPAAAATSMGTAAATAAAAALPPLLQAAVMVTSKPATRKQAETTNGRTHVEAKKSKADRLVKIDGGGTWRMVTFAWVMGLIAMTL